MTVGPRNLKPRAFRSLAQDSASGMQVGKSLMDLSLCRMGLPPTQDHMYLENVPNSLCTSWNRLALLMVAAILARFLTMPASFSSRAVSFFPNLATFL